MSKRRVSMMVVVSTVLLLTWAALAGAAQAATFRVTNTNDSGAGSLRQAILDANASPGADTIRILTAGIVTLSSALPAVSDNVTIVGPGASSFTIDVNGTGTGLQIDAGVTASVSGLTITGAADSGILNIGTLTVTAVTLSQNTASGGSGAKNLGTMMVLNSAIEDNSSTTFGGGGIANGADANLSLSGSTVSGNKAASGGGGIFSLGQLSIKDSTIVNNTAASTVGGGVFLCADDCTPPSQSTTTITNTVIEHNDAQLHGGGIWIEGIDAKLTVTNSTIDYNYSGSSGGGLGVAGATADISASEVAFNSTQSFGGGGAANGGNLQISSSRINDNTAANSGGGIINTGVLTLIGVTVENNVATVGAGGGVYNCDPAYCSGVTGTAISHIYASKVDDNTAQYGGGIANISRFGSPDSAAQIFIDGTSISRNTATIHDGGIINQEATMSVTRSMVNENQGGDIAGGIANFGPLSIDSSTISGNDALTAGGIANASATITFGTSANIAVASDATAPQFVDEEANQPAETQDVVNLVGNLTMTNSLISNNTATGTDTTHGPAGGLYNTAIASLANVTISGNEAGAGHSGGGIFNCAQSCGGAAPNLSMLNVTIANNTADFGAGIDNDSGATATAENTLLSGNSTSNCGGSLTSLGHNLSSDFSCNFFSLGDLNGVFANIGPLADNGGPTLTHALRATSPAIDAGSNSDCPDTDQRGEPRPADGNGDRKAVCDIGAYEVQPNSSLSSFFHPRGR